MGHNTREQFVETKWSNTASSYGTFLHPAQTLFISIIGGTKEISGIVMERIKKSKE